MYRRCISKSVTTNQKEWIAVYKTYEPRRRNEGYTTTIGIGIFEILGRGLYAASKYL